MHHGPNEMGYDGTCRHLTQEQVKKEAAGLPFVISFRYLNVAACWAMTQVLGRIELNYSEVDDFVIVRSNNKPLYLLYVLSMISATGSPMCSVARIT